MTTSQELPKCKCMFPDCRHEWVPRVSNPLRCPKCLRYDWDVGPGKNEEKRDKKR